MKSLRKLNFFRQNKHVKEDKENLDESHHVRFDDRRDIIIKEQPQRKVLKRHNSDENIIHASAAYHTTNPKPRAYRPTQSCYDQRPSNNDPASSSDDDDKSTLVSQRTSYRKPSRRQQQVCTMQLQQNVKKVQICTNDYALQTSSEYGSGDPSPINDHVTFESHHFDGSHGSDYWKRKYREYKNMCRMLHNENSRLRDKVNLYVEKQKLYEHISEEANTLRTQNRDLHAQISSLNMQLRSFERSHYMPHPASTYPMFPSLLPSQFNNNNNPQHGAGERLASQSQIPKYAPSSLMSSSLATNHFDEEDETKNFRTNALDQSSDEPFHTSPLSYSSSPLEQARRESNFESSSPHRHDRSISLTILQDDGYGTNQSNQTLTAILPTTTNSEQKSDAPENMSTPIKPLPIRRRVRFLSN